MNLNVENAIKVKQQIILKLSLKIIIIKIFIGKQLKNSII